MSTTSNYLLLLLLAGIAGGVVGVVVHAARAIIAENEVPDYDNGFVIVQVKKPWLAGNPFFERRVLKLDYNDDGTYDGHSLRNIALQFGLGAGSPLVAGLLAWPFKATVLAETCTSLAQFAVQPLFCL